MSFRVQFTITDKEYQHLMLEMEYEGFPNISELCKSRALGEKTNLAELYKTMESKIQKLPSGREFYLRDIIGNPPALLGRWLFENVENGKIPDVIHIESAIKPERYRKI